MDFDKIDPKTMGRYLRHYRKMAGMTAKLAGSHLDRSQQWIYNVESGSISPEPRVMFALLDLYGVRRDDAFSESWDVVDNPSRSRSAAGKRLLELQEMFPALGDADQKLVLGIVRRLKG